MFVSGVFPSLKKSAVCVYAFLLISLYSPYKDSKNHEAYFRRGMAYLALGNLRMALSDFDFAANLNSGYVPAIKQRSLLNLKFGNIKEAKNGFNFLVSFDADAKKHLTTIERIEFLFQEAQKEYEKQDYVAALPIIEEILEHCTHHHSYLEMKAKSLIYTGETRRLMYDSGLALQSLEEVRSCLRLDQEDKDCKQHYKKIKKLANAISKSQDTLEASNYKDCVKYSSEVLTLEPTHQIYQIHAKIDLCKCHTKWNSGDGLKFCEEVVEKFPENTDYQCDLAEIYLNVERYQDAISTYQRILETDRQNDRARKGLSRAQKMSKQKRNYYKILGVSPTATKKQIESAYRKLAAEHHPDKYEDKKLGEKKFMDIAAAKEVLTNDEKRRMFDQGIDPLDPEQAQHGRAHNPFGRGFPFSFGDDNFFEGGNFHFYFG